MSKVLAQFRRFTALLRRQGRSRHDAEDLVQEAFLRMAVYCETGKEIRSADAFLMRTIQNLAINAAEHERVRANVPQPVEELDLADLGPAPDELLAAEQGLHRIQRALAGVSPRTKEVFFMHRLHGLSYAQIADHFDLSISAVEKHIAKAMAVLGPQMHQLYRELQGR
jgi:RNA polymerase sigma-70 factor (ECF subfamily)